MNFQPKTWMDLGPKSPSNEFVENRLEKWALVDQTNLIMDSDIERMKKRGFMLESIVLGKIRGGLFLYIVLKLSYKFEYRMFQCFSFSSSPLFCLPFLFISSSLLVPTSHVYIRGLVLILVSSTPSISLHEL